MSAFEHLPLISLPVRRLDHARRPANADGIPGAGRDANDRLLREHGPASAVGEATALFIAGFGAAGYATRRDLTAIARASFWAGRTAVTDQGPARVVHGRDRMASGAIVDGSST